MIDLFGNDVPVPRAFYKPVEGPVQVDLFTAKAEALALSSGRSLSQERTEIVAPQIAGAGLRCIFDHAITRDGVTRKLTCVVCDR